LPTYKLLERILFPPTYLNRERLAREIEGKTILITGASSGIGEQLSYLLAEYRVHLILVARRESRLLEMKSEITARGAEVSVFAADLRDQQEMDGLLSFLHQLPGGVDILLSNAGHSIRRSIRESLDRYHDFTRTMAINYLAPVQLLLSLFPLLARKKGRFINISTVNALLHPVPYWAAYQASKGAFDIWLRSAAPELNEAGITVTSIYLPLVRTPMILPTASYRKWPAMTAEHAAKLIARIMYSRRTQYKPWWLWPGQLGSVLFGRLIEYQILRNVRKKGNRV
jgi:short-subunit dehydrogenase